MAAEDSNRVAFEKELDDTLSCCICTEFYTNPKALPCIHTFCMKCIQETGLKNNKGPGDEMPCPICRRMFKIPSEGFHGLPNNFLIAKLIEVANVSNLPELSKNLCDVCLGNEEEMGSEIPEANMFCIDCNQKLCEECCRQHRKFKLNKNHKLIPLNEQQVSYDCTVKLAPSVCELHEQKVLDIYCDECKTVECAVCFIDGHKQHEGSHVSKYVDDFRKQIESNIDTINQGYSQSQMKKAELNKIKEDMQQKVEKLEEDVMKRRDEVKQFADSQANSLLQSLSSLSRSKLKEIQIEADDIDAHLSCLQSYSSYCKKMMAKGSASDVCRAVSDLSFKATELQEQCHSLIEREIPSFKFCFTKSELEEFLEYDNLIGEIEEDSKSRQKTTATPKVALIRKQSNEIELLKDDINLERREETFRLENEQLQMIANNEKEANKMSRNELIRNLASYSAEISQLKLYMDKEKTTMKTLQANTEKRIKQINEELDCEKTKSTTLQGDIDKLKTDFDTERATTKKLSQELDCEKTKSSTLQGDIDKLKKAFDTEQTTAKKLSQELACEKTKYKTLQAGNKTLDQELETQQKAMQDLLKGKEQENEVWEKTKTEWGAKLLDLEQKQEEERKTSTKEKEELISQIQEHHRLMDKLRSEYRLDATLVQTFRTKAAEEKTKSIQGLTILDNELFVVSEMSSEVEVYDSMTLSFSRKWSLKELIQPQDIVSCDRNKCLYIFDYKGYLSWSNEILRVDPNGILIKKWLTGINFGYSLSVTHESNVILPVYNAKKVNEYSPDGQLIKALNIQVGPEVCELWHAVKLTSGDFVVSIQSSNLIARRMTPYHGVYIVDGVGKLKQLFKETNTPTNGYMKEPGHLSVDRNGFVMVVDRENSRVLLLDSDLKFKREILSKEEKHELRHPIRILLDESNGRLLVADNDLNNQRILIFRF